MTCGDAKARTHYLSGESRVRLPLDYRGRWHPLVQQQYEVGVYLLFRAYNKPYPDRKYLNPLLSLVKQANIQ